MSAFVRVTGFDHIVLITSDVAKSLDFYIGVLGLEGVRVDDWHRGEAPFPSVRVNPQTLIDLIQGDRTGTNLAHFCLVIEPTDLDALAANDSIDVVSGPTDGLFGAQGFTRSLYIRDPDDNVIELRSY